MKSLFRSMIAFILARRAHRLLKKNKVQVIAVTGSVGKTSTKEAVYAVLKSKFEVGASKKSFNTPIGMSLAILGEEQSGFSSVKAWLKILTRVCFRSKELAPKMVLEMGADARGNIRELMRIAPPQISIVTAVREVHLDEKQFKSLEDIAEEKSTLVRLLPPDGIAILNADDPRVIAMETPAHTKMSFGVENPADLRAQHLQATLKGIKFEVEYQGLRQAFEVPVLGAYQVYVCLPAIAVGLCFGMTLAECAAALRHFRLPPGRMNPIEGLQETFILDGSYNASPTTVLAGLEMLKNFEASRKIAALGTMNELGKRSHEAHLEVGRQVAQVADLLIAVGREAQTLKQGALEGGLSEEKIYSFVDSKEAGEFLKQQLHKGDLILVKGSQNKVRMERLIKVIMAHPEKAPQLLCRQEAGWEE